MNDEEIKNRQKMENSSESSGLICIYIIFNEGCQGIYLYAGLRKL
jgi:hypothetical protein